MIKPWVSLLLSIAAFAVTANAAHAATCPYAPESRSFSEACVAGNCFDSGSQAGHPGVSSISRGSGFEGYNFSSDSGLAIDNGFFASTSHTGGSATIEPFSSKGSSSRSTGDVYDCLTISGGVGDAQLHIPIAIQGGALASWSIGGAYVPAETFDPAYARLTMHCSGYHFGSATSGPCSQIYDVIYDVSQPIDTTIELVFQFHFDDPITIQYGPRVVTQVGYAANGSDGTLQGTADLDLEGQLLSAYVTDFSSIVLPSATISATSGFDYFQPVPEPGASAAGVGAAITIAALRRRTTASR